MSLVTPDFGLLFWMTLIFAIVFFVLAKWGFPAITGMVDKRSDRTIKCFDEGVDVPKLDKIYIMASDSALRQTVQRRGRVLRKCKESGKTIAYIYDMVVLPALEIGTYGCEGLLKIELSRAREYNRLALNKEENESVFCEIENKYHITIDNVTNYETEPD